ncbi:MAG: hypothetical protein NT170_04250, partial [Candidatus Moranbacteria bacterium]|nr:hypothetical protein [Candidatus Moranbacteria bacterium]
MTKTKKKSKTKKAKKTTNIPKNTAMRGTSAPECFLFGLIIASALLFSYLSWQGAGHIQTNFTSAGISNEKNVFQKKINDLV